MPRTIRILALLLLVGATTSAATSYDAVLAWEVGTDEDDVFFGVISGLDVDADGNVFVCDRQLTTVSMFAPDGTFVGHIGREGEGPGEYARIGDVFVAAPGELGVVQRMPGRIVTVRLDGSEGSPIRLDAASSGAPAYVFSVRRTGDDAVVVLSRQFERDGTDLEESTTLRVVLDTGVETAVLSRQTQERDLTDFRVDEAASAPPVWAVGPAGEIYVNDDFDAYVIRVVDRDGRVLRTIEHDFESRRRSAREIELNVPSMQINTREGGSHVARGTASPVDRDVQALFPRPDGSLWVLSSRGAFDVADGVLARFDVFDAEGRPADPIVVRGDASFRDDDLHVFGDRLFVLRGQRAALRNQRGQDDDREATPMTVGCYRLVAAADG